MIIKSPKNILIPGEDISPGKLIARFLLALAATLALRVNYSLDPYALSGLFSRLASSFSPGGIADVFVFALVFIMLGFAGLRKKPDVWALILAFVFALLWFVCMVMSYVKNFSFVLADLGQLCLSAFCIFGYTVLFYAGLCCLYMLMDRGIKADKEIPRPMAFAFCVILICWLPWAVMNYPGSMCNDSALQLSQFLGFEKFTAHHPPLSSLIMGLCYSLGRALWNPNFGVFLYIMLHTLCGALIFAKVCQQAYRMVPSRWLYGACLAFYAVSPLWGGFVQWFEKDLLYAEVFALAILALLPVLEERCCSWRRAGIVFVCSALVLLLRNNGKYELMPLLLLLLPWLKNEGRKRMIPVFLALVLVNFGVGKVLYPALDIKAGSIREMLSIPFQQTAYYVNTFPDEVSAEERAAIDAVLDYEALDGYRPYISDPVKDTYKEDASALPAYFRAWFGMFLKHPPAYVEAALLNCYASLSPCSVVTNVEIHTSTPEKFTALFGVESVTGEGLTTRFLDYFNNATGLPLLRCLSMSGSYTWLLMMCFVYLLRKKRFSALLLCVPGIMNVLICIASPLNGSARYALPLIAMAPILVSWTLMHSKEKI